MFPFHIMLNDILNWSKLMYIKIEIKRAWRCQYQGVTYIYSVKGMIIFMQYPKEEIDQFSQFSMNKRWK